ncbi:hypothetical protein [Alkalicoccobacillus murimartini]|uniref:DUF4367 domain-containing protein n=1 Tax=Alkalicoccobacillus murimartini TaxID=171685 RepID=A0ABT9YHS6_9BACI|nr:hypothetical protein [Alkalicoccobacillus murimartini]MDQ0207415.1 hypothetical protein [Alkalicoccobacillus murimartini]
MDNHSNDKKYIILPHSAYTKSLNAFKQGMDDIEKPKPKNRATYVAGIGVAVLLGLLALTFIPAIDDQDHPAEQKETEREEVKEEHIINLNEIKENDDLLSQVLVRGPLDLGSGGGSETIHSGEFSVIALSDWQLISYGSEFEHGSKAVIEGPAGLHQTILLFDEEATQDEMDQAKTELLSNYRYTEATRVPVEELKNYKEKNNVTDSSLMERFKDRFAIELDEETKFYTMTNEQEGRLYDYVEATMFDKKLILFSDVPNTHQGLLSASYFTLSSITPEESYEVSIGPYDQKHGRPITRTMLMGGFQWEYLELDLYEHELGFTSYIREGATLEKIERTGFTEWKFSDEGTKENRYYSFGKLDPEISLEDAKLTLIDGYGLDRKFIDGTSQISFHHYEPSINTTRSFELVQKQGEWYYIFSEDDHSEGFIGPGMFELASKFQQEIIFD